MNEIDRDLSLALLKRLWQRDLISEETFISASNSRFFDKKRFAHYAEADDPNPRKEASTHDDGQKTS